SRRHGDAGGIRAERAGPAPREGDDHTAVASNPRTTTVPDAKQITDDLRNTFRGRLAFDGLVRGLYATDASPFQVTPLGVAFPLDAEDLSVLVRYCSEHGIALIPRGAGTGVAGESLGPGLVVDLSAHFRRILDIA